MNMSGTSESTLDADDDRSVASHRRPTPSSVVKAYYAMVTALVLTLVSGVVAVVFPPTTKAYADFIQGMHFPTDPASTRAAAEAGATAAVVNLVLIVIFVVIFYAFGRMMRDGANWARIIVAVFAVLGVLDGVAVAVTTAVLAPIPIAGGTVGLGLLLILALALTAYLVLVFQPASNRYFAAVRRAVREPEPAA